jgi:hypothetical protein
MIPPLFERKTAGSLVWAAPDYETAVKPQMKKYRCLWGVSTTNHNILYFVVISGIPSLNTAFCLWKPGISLARRGFFARPLPQIRFKPGSRAASRHGFSVFPPHTPHKAQKQGTFGDFPVQMWTFWAFSGPSSRPRQQGIRRTQNESSANANRPRMHRTQGRSVVSRP